MVLGLRSKHKKGASVHVDYIIHILEIKPWPPSQSLKSLRSVVLHWENGDRSSGSTSIVTPNLGSSATEGRIEFNESFKLDVTLLKDGSSKVNDKGAFQKNLLEFNLYEPRRDKSKGQHLGSALIDLADHGVIKDTMNAGILVSSKRSFRNTAQPVLYVRIQPLNNGSISSSSRETLSKEASLDGKESVSDLMNEEYAEEAEIASFTDDDVSSPSSLANSSSALEANADFSVHNGPDVEDYENVHQKVKEDEEVHDNDSKLLLTSEPAKVDDDDSNLLLAPEPAKVESQVTEVSCATNVVIDQNVTLPDSLLVGSSNNNKILEDCDGSESRSSQESSMLTMEKSEALSMVSSSFTHIISPEGATGFHTVKEAADENLLMQEIQEKSIDCKSTENIVDVLVQNEDNSVITNIVEPSDFAFQMNKSDISEAKQNFDQEGKSEESRNESEEADHGARYMSAETETEPSVEANEVESHLTENENITSALENTSIATAESAEHISVIQQHSILQNTGTISTDLAISSRRSFGEKHSNTYASERLKTMKLSVRSPPRLMGSIAYGASDQYKEDVKEIDIQEDACNNGTNSSTDDGRDDNESTSSGSSKVKHVSRVNGRGFSNNKVHELEFRVKLLEAELREAAAIEIGLYSIVAEHGSSAHKVHTPARRLSRLYNHASRQWSTKRRASAARSIASGLALVAKACGNDVARHVEYSFLLTFWLSNTIVLRAIVTETSKHPDIPKSASIRSTNNGSVKLPQSKSSPLKWESISHKNEKFYFSEEFGDWDDPDTLISALERIENWIFSRTVESVWWQTLTPCMQSGYEGSDQQLGSYSQKSYGRTPSMGDQQQGNLSVEIWNRAFRDASERLCPLRSEGHECGCLHMLARLVMEQCVARLDVAMFNAILRESDDEIPTDPVSDPIGDSKVLPIPTSEFSFGAGAQLKNGIGNWSRWLTDLFGMDVDDFDTEENDQDDDKIPISVSFKSFHLLNALSDLLMLPKDLLLEKSIRKEVCPTFSASMIKHILSRFLPDEFCPDPIPDAVLQALESEEPFESSQEEIRNIPCDASPIIYSPPSVTSIKNIVGEVRSTSFLRRIGSSVLRKCHTSDDELEELDSPLATIITDNFSSPKIETKHASSSFIRYQLLREVWRDDD
ncbi:unnamed protein product [Musa acuminata var. zebrina]